MTATPSATEARVGGHPYVRAFGLDFPGPVGLGAGYDRTGERLPELDRAGFGFVELGTVTPEPVDGHNPGVDALAAAVMRHRARRRPARPGPLIGINLGRQPDHPLREAGCDFAIAMRSAWDCADYLAINLTGPAAQPLHAPERTLERVAVLEHVRQQQERLTAMTGRRTPVLLKYPIVLGAPLDRALALRFDGLIAVFEDAQDRSPVYAAQRDLARMAEALRPSTTLVAGSGVRSAGDAAHCLAAGARLVQIHRAYLEHGDALIVRINQKLAAARRWYS